MSIWRLAWRYLWSRPAVTLLTLAGVMLGAALVSTVLTLRRETERVFLAESGLFDLVVGAKGSPLQLVLSSVYHLDIPTGNIPLERYEALARDPRVAAAWPVGLGDNFRGHRIVGTTPDFLGLTRRDADSGTDKPVFALAGGRVFAADFEAVLGADVARRTGLRPGDTFAGSHGLVVVPGSEEHDTFPYTVVGILAPSGTSADRAVYTTLESVWRIHDAEEEHHRELFGEGDGEDAGEDAAGEDFGALFGGGGGGGGGREVTAVLVRLKTPGMRLWMADEIQTGTESMAAIPINEMLRLYQEILGPMQRLLLAVAGLVVAVSALSIIATLWQSVERRRRDVAVMRCLGAHPGEVFLLVLAEAFFLTFLGVVLGWMLAHGGIALAGGSLQERIGFAISPWSMGPEEWRALGIILAAGFLAGAIPAMAAYRRSPAEDLAGS